MVANVRQVVLAIFVALFCMNAHATHYSGGEIYYECLGNNEYELTFVIYRDCAGIQLDPQVTVDIDSPCDNFQLTLNTPNGVEVSQLCDLELPNSSCNGGNLPGIEQYVYTAMVTLPPCDSWTISWAENYRNGAIVNLQDPDSQPMYLHAILDNTVDNCNNSPQFTNIASPYVCLNYPMNYSYGVFDTDADSLTYTLIDAMTNGGAPIPYVAPYTGLEPITGMVLDPNTGLLSFTPVLAGNWVVVVQVDQYNDQGELIGSVIRDMQFIAYPCTNIPPDPTTGSISNLSGEAVLLGPNEVQVCESGSFCYDFTISDVNPNNILDATTNIQQNLPGATFSFTGTNPITCTVCWSAGPGTAGFFPFIVTVDDGACPIPGFQTYVYSVQVLEGLFTDIQTVDESCAGNDDGSATVTVTAGTGPYIYDWDNGNNTSSITAGAGTYTLTVTDANGCVATPLYATIDAAAQPSEADAGSDLIACMGTNGVALQGSVVNAPNGTWSGGAGTFSGAWPNVSYTPNAAEFANGTVDLVLTSNGAPGCPLDTDTATVQLSNAFINTQVSATDVLCNGQASGSAMFTPAGGGLTYLWDDQAQQTTAVAGNLVAGTYNLMVTDQLGCDSSYTATINEPAPIVVDVLVAEPLCNGQNNGTATATVTGGTPAYSYQWGSNAGGQNMPIAGNLGEGTYVVTVLDANGCTEQGTAVLTSPDPIVLTASVPDTVCVGQPVTLTASAIGGTGALNIEWAGIGSGSPITHSFSGPETVVVTVTDANGCPGANQNFQVNVLDLNNGFLSAYGDTTVCNGGNAIVGANLQNYPGTVYYNWPQLGLSGPGPFTVPVLIGQTVTVNVTDVCGTQLSDQVTLDLEVAPTFALPPVIAEGCAPLTVQFPNLNLPGALTYEWQLGDGNTSIDPTPLHTYSAGTYVAALTVATPAGCTSTNTSGGQIFAYAPPIAAFMADPATTTIDDPNISFTDLSTGNIIQYDWDFGDGAWSDLQNPAHTYGNIGIYPVDLWVRDANGCVDSVKHNVEITPVYDITIPNVFTPDPNGGGGGYWDPENLDNDVFYAFLEYVEEYQMRIYNRWGELIFESDDAAYGWDGTYRGNMSPQDAYVYKLWVKFIDGKEMERKGDITLLR